MKVLCSHKMNTTNFVCKDPDSDAGARFYVPVIAGQPVMVDERIVAQYSSTFTIIEQETPEPESASDADDVIDTDDGDTGPADIESLDSAALTADDTDIKDDTEHIADDEGFGPDEVEPVKNDAENEDVKFVEETPGPDITEDIEAEEKAHAEAELMSTIDSFKGRAKLDAWAAGIGVKLDGRQKLATMKAAAKKALNLG